MLEVAATSEEEERDLLLLQIGEHFCMYWSHRVLYIERVEAAVMDAKAGDPFSDR